jgi:hypothetical protein
MKKYQGTKGVKKTPKAATGPGAKKAMSPSGPGQQKRPQKKKG